MDDADKGHDPETATGADGQWAELQARIIERLRAGVELGAEDKEERWRVRAVGDAFVWEVFDQLMVGAPPIRTGTLATEAALLDWIRPSPESLEAWTALADRLGPPVAEPEVFEPGAVDGLVVFSEGAEVAWVAFLEGVEPRWLAGALRPHIRVRVELAEQPGRGPLGPFAWRLPVPERASRAASPEPWVRAAVTSRLADRLALSALLDLSASTPFEGGHWTAHHADRYETEGVGFVVTYVGVDGQRVAVPVDLARPGTADHDRERTAARTRLSKVLRRALY